MERPRQGLLSFFLRLLAPLIGLYSSTKNEVCIWQQELHMSGRTQMTRGKTFRLAEKCEGRSAEESSPVACPGRSPASQHSQYSQLALHLASG